MSIVSRVAFAVCFLLVAAATGWAQDGVITGRVTDPSGGALPGVDVALTSPALLGGRSTVSDEQGTYRFAVLPPGAYSVRFQLQGFGTVVREGVTLTPGFTSSLNIVMEVGSLAETVTVTGESPIVDVTNAVVATNFSKELTAVLPTGHDVFSMLAITPGVQVTAPDVGGSRAGQRAQFRVFGSTSQWNVIEGAIMASLQYEDPDVYEEVQVAGASKGADAPVGGSFNNFIVKSGGNDLHGLFFYDREPLALQSSNLSPELEAQGVTNTSSVARYQSVHADVGGPLRARQILVVLCLPQPELRQLDTRLLQHRHRVARAGVHDAAEPCHQAELPPQLEPHAGLFGAVQHQVPAQLGGLGVCGFGVDVAHRLPVLDPRSVAHVDPLQPIHARGEVG